MKNPYQGKQAGRNIFITIALIAIGVFIWNAYISPLMAFGDAVNIKNTGSCTFTCFLTGINNDASFTVSPGQTKTVSLPNIGGIYQGACYDPSKYVHGNSATYTAINTANSFTYNLNIPQTNCIGTTTTQATGTTQAGGSTWTGQCGLSGFDTNKDCNISKAEWQVAADLKEELCWGTTLSPYCADYTQRCWLAVNNAYSNNILYYPCDFGTQTDCNTAALYDVDKNCQIQTAEYTKAVSDRNAGIITANCLQVVIAGYQNWALRQQAYTGCSFSGCTDSQLWAFDANKDNKISITELDMCQVSSVLCYPRCVLEYNKNLVTTTLPYGVTTTLPYGVTTTTLTSNCFTSWYYAQALGAGSCIQTQFCNYNGVPTVYQTEQLCKNANPSNIDAKLIGLIIIGVVVIGIAVYYNKKGGKK